MDADERDVWQVELIQGLPWVVGTAVAVEPEPAPVSAVERWSPYVDERTVVEVVEPAEATGARRDWSRWEWPVLIGTLCWCAAVGVGVVTGGIPLGMVSWQMAVGVVSAAPLLVGLVVTCPRPAEDGEQFWTWGSEPGVYAQCAPSRVTFTHGAGGR